MIVRTTRPPRRYLPRRRRTLNSFQVRGGRILVHGGHVMLGCCCCLDTCNARCNTNATPRVIDIDIVALMLCGDCYPTSMLGGGAFRIAPTGSFSGTFRCVKPFGQTCQWVYTGGDIVLKMYRLLNGACDELLATYDNNFTITVDRVSTTKYTVCILVAGALLGYYEVTTADKDCLTRHNGIANLVTQSCGYVTVLSNEYGSCVSSLISVAGNFGTINLIPRC